MQHFLPHEFQCLCDYDCGMGFQDMKEELVEAADLGRSISGVPWRIRSAIRCTRHNRDVGGKELSAHTKGWALDVEALTAHTKFRIVYGMIKAGFHRIGVYETFVHGDMDPELPKEVIWKGE